MITSWNRHSSTFRCYLFVQSRVDSFNKLFSVIIISIVLTFSEISCLHNPFCLNHNQIIWCFQLMELVVNEATENVSYELNESASVWETFWTDFHSAHRVVWASEHQVDCMRIIFRIVIISSFELSILKISFCEFFPIRLVVEVL